jgi:class 3 adenylate cyclase/pimeloyl-ACP methyl ester carboxylesterase
MEIPETQYARSGDAYIAYQVAGDGPVDLVWAPGGFQNVELWWESRHRAETTRRLAEIARVVRFDKRGTGLSDRAGGLPPFDVQMDDVRAVMDAAGLERAFLFGIHDTSALTILFAATFPERVLGLALWGPKVAFTRKPDMPWLPTPAEYEQHIADEVVRVAEPSRWHEHLRRIAPSLSADEREEFGRVLRLSTSPGDAAALLRLLGETDVRHVLPTVRVPTLVLQREGFEQDLAGSRYVAERIATARLALLPGRDAIVVVGGVEPLVRELESFAREVMSAPPEEPDRVLATVLFTDIVGSTARSAELGDARWRELLGEHHTRVRRELARFRGREVDTAGDGFFATFDGPARAIRCACAVRESVRDLGLELRAGLHAGECELLDGKATGIAVSLGARVAAHAEAGEVLVSSTVKDLVAGSGIGFADRGVAELKGIPGEWRIFAVES